MLTAGPGYVDVTWAPPTDGGRVDAYGVAWLVDGVPADGVGTLDTSYRISGLPAGAVIVVGVGALQFTPQGSYVYSPLATESVVVPG